VRGRKRLRRDDRRSTIDERKARTLCAASFPRLVIASTVELLMHNTTAAALGGQGQVDALMNALANAHMRVPMEHLAELRTIIGAERAASCPSFPKHVQDPQAIDSIAAVHLSP
jgi:hypothetical protein